MAKTVSCIRNAYLAFHNDESGQGLIEYALVMTLIGLATVAGMGYVSREVNATFSALANRLKSGLK